MIDGFIFIILLILLSLTGHFQIAHSWLHIDAMPSTAAIAAIRADTPIDTDISPKATPPASWYAISASRHSYYYWYYIIDIQTYEARCLAESWE